MMRILISISVLLLLGSSAASAQGSPPNDSTAKIVSDTATGERDSSIVRTANKPHESLTASPIVASHKKSWPCADVPHWKCVAFGALIVGSIGYSIGVASSPKAEGHKEGLFFGGTEVCDANCGMPQKAITFAIGGSVIGGWVGWLLGR